MRKYRSSHDTCECKGEKVIGISKTVPDQAPTMRELLVRHANGITDNVSQNLSFSGELPDLRGYEPHDINRLLYEQQQRVEELKIQSNELAVKQREAQYQAKREYDKKLLQELKNQES